MAEKYQNPCTPNAVAIYCLGKIVEDMLAKGVDVIRQEIAQKAQLLYNAIEENENLDIFVKQPEFRSATVIVANVKKGSKELIQRLKENGMILGSGYGEYKESQVRIANFPTHTIGQIKELINKL